MTLDNLDFPTGENLVDPIVHMHLIGGKVIELREVSIVELAKRLHKYGFVFLSDGEGSYAVFNDHGVAAITAGNQ